MEKTPHNVFYADLILQLYPDARFIHLIRDPRAVVASLRATAQGWGGHWAERGVLAGSARWMTHVNAGLAISRRGVPCLEVYYESLSRDSVAEFQRIFDWMGLAASAADCTAFVEAQSVARMRGQGVGELGLLPTRNSREFVRKGCVDSWRHDLGKSDVFLIEGECGELMRKLGYELVSAAGQRSITTLPTATAASIVPLGRYMAIGLRWRLDRWFESIEKAL